MKQKKGIIDLSQQVSYEQGLARAEAKLASAKTEVEYLKLQIKETERIRRLAVKNLLIRRFVAAMPADSVEIMPSPGLIYVAVQLPLVAAAKHRDIPEKLGLDLISSRPNHNGIASPILREYRKQGEPVKFFVTEHVV